MKNMFKVMVFSLLAIVLIVGAVFMYVNGTFGVTEPVTQETSEETQGETIQKAMGIEQYVTTHISALSPTKEVLGGTFYVTDIQVNPAAGTGTVWYEDGHIALVADFTYSQEMEHGAITIHSFVVRE